GLTDDPLSLSWPVARSEVAGYIERRASEWKTLDSPPPVQLQQRTARLWLLLQRAKLEQMQ
ncbi:MAG TPA: hypothetical protein PLD59_04020, partial [Tepidisphaeraceae bacterium]|nr:hypothetical protein [Tepidisphaeraceae bacterium]